MELKPNMYVRTKKGTFNKVLKIDETLKYENEDRLIVNEEDWFLVESDLVKASYNIIDLIEVGDYVNGVRVERIDKDPFIKGQVDLWTNEITSNYWGDIGLTPIRDKDIKSIVTKEQFESMSYKVGE